MNSIDSRKIQRNLLDALIVKSQGRQVSGLKDKLVREICKSFSRENSIRVYYNHFLPLVRAGLIECAQTEEGRLQSWDTLCWMFSKPAVFFKDTTEKRQWIGLNLTEEMIDKITQEYTLLNDEDDLYSYYSYIITWETPLTYKGDGLPVRYTPSPETLLKGVYPNPCSTDYFASEDKYPHPDNCLFIYNPAQWDDYKFAGSDKKDGLYRQSSEPFSRRIYYRHGNTYSLKPAPDSESWARIMHCIDNNLSVVEYDQAQKTLTFRQPVPILLGRILFTNQMFSDMKNPEIPGQEYRCVSLAIFKELLRIFSNRGNMKGE